MTTYFNANQIEFVNLIINQLVDHDVVDVALLYESPFTDVSPQGPDTIFSTKQIEKIMQLLDSIRSMAIAASISAVDNRSSVLLTSGTVVGLLTGRTTMNRRADNPAITSAVDAAKQLELRQRSLIRKVLVVPARTKQPCRPSECQHERGRNADHIQYYQTRLSRAADECRFP